MGEHYSLGFEISDNNSMAIHARQLGHFMGHASSSCPWFIYAIHDVPSSFTVPLCIPVSTQHIK